MNAIRIGMVGYKFMGKAHSHAYHDVGLFFPDVANPIRKAICGRDPCGVEKAARQFGRESAETDWRELVKRDDIDLIDIPGFRLFGSCRKTSPVPGRMEI